MQAAAYAAQHHAGSLCNAPQPFFGRGGGKSSGRTTRVKRQCSSLSTAASISGCYRAFLLRANACSLRERQRLVNIGELRFCYFCAKTAWPADRTGGTGDGALLYVRKRRGWARYAIFFCSRGARFNLAGRAASVRLVRRRRARQRWEDIALRRTFSPFHLRLAWRDRPLWCVSGTLVCLDCMLLCPAHCCIAGLLALAMHSALLPRGTLGGNLDFASCWFGAIRDGSSCGGGTMAPGGGRLFSYGADGGRRKTSLAAPGERLLALGTCILCAFLRLR